MVCDRSVEMLVGMALAEWKILYRNHDDLPTGFAIETLPCTALALGVLEICQQHLSSNRIQMIWEKVRSAVQHLPPSTAISASDLLQMPLWILPLACSPQVTDNQFMNLLQILAQQTGSPDIIPFGSWIACQAKLCADLPDRGLWLAAISEFASQTSDDFEHMMLRLGHVLSWGSERNALKHLESRAKLSEVFAQSIYILYRHPTNYGDAIDCAINFAGDPYKMSVLVGGLAAACPGIRDSMELYDHLPVYSWLVTEIRRRLDI